MYVIQIILIIWLISSIRFREGAENTFLNSVESQQIKGFIIVYLVIYHTSLVLNVRPGIIQVVDNYIATTGVALFSFFSAYGVEKKFQADRTSFYGWLIKKGLFVAGIYAFFLALKLIIGIPYDSGGMMWINTFLLSMIFAGVSHKVFGDRAWILYTILWLVYFIIATVFHNPIFWWPNPSLGYAYGCIMANRSAERPRLYRILVSLSCIVVALVLNILYISVGEYPNVTPSMEMMRSLSFVFILIAIVQLLYFVSLKNKLMGMAGMLSLYFFMIHGGVICLLESKIQGPLYIIIVLVCTAIVSVVSYILAGWVTTQLIALSERV